MSDDDLLDLEAAASVAGVKPATLSSYLSRGTMPEPDLRFGRAPVWRRSTINRWLTSRVGRGLDWRRGRCG